MAWAYLHKGGKRTVGGYLRTILKGNFTELKQRWQVQFSKKDDPFFTFPYLDALHDRFQLKPIYFVLLGDYDKFDTNISPNNWAFLWILQQLHKRYRLGIHPSYSSNKKRSQLQKEISRLRVITQEPVALSRQHFLKLTFPETYRRLLQVGIAVDYSLGYADDIGFRASIATPYPWYDLTQETMNPLLLYPFQVMDVTLKKYLQLNPAQAIENVNLIIQKTKSVGGTFCTLWHNSSFSYIDNWEGWDEVYEAILKMATQQKQD